MSEINQTAPVTDEELDQMIWKLERDGGMTPKMLSLMRELREVRRARLVVQPVMFIDGDISASDADKLASIIREWDDAPAPVAPDECALFEAAIDKCRKSEAIDEHAWNNGVLVVMAKFEECRAAMLNHSGDTADMAEPVSSRDELPAKCWCQTCRPVTMNDMRFVVCPECGNKRCPRANDHRNACTGSNAPGQDGSAYPAVPKEVKGE